MSQPSSPSAPVGSAPPKPPPPVVRPAPESRLEQLTARYDETWQREKEAKAELEQLKVAIKSELSRLHPEAEEVLLHSSYLKAPLQMKARPRVTFDTETCKTKYPQVYATFAQFTTVWYLSRITS